MLLCILLAVAALTPADNALLEKDESTLKGDERARYAELAMRKFLIEEGGAMVKPGTPKGVIKFINCQTFVDVKRLASIPEYVESATRFDVRLESRKATVTLANARQMRKESNAEVAVFIVNDPSLPALTVCPDEGYAFVNVGGLGNAETKPSFLAARTRKEMLRAFAYMTAGSRYGTPLYRRIEDPKELDEQADEDFPVDITMRAHIYLSALGFKERIESTYKELIESGLDIAPTNEYQKAIWEKVQNKKADKADPTARWKRDFEKK